MKPILHARHRGILDRFIRRRALIAFDYDGTLAPIVADPAEARMRPVTRESLESLARRTAVAVITGRARDDAHGLLQGVPLQQIIGNHGLEGFDPVPQRFAARVRLWHDALEHRLAGQAGIVIEDKRFSLAIHYRHCAEPIVARQLVTHAASTLPAARLVGGKFVLNVIPVEAPNKGDAIYALCRQLDRRCAIYVGDDETDEDVFSRRRSIPVLGIRVGAVEDSGADYLIESQLDMDQLLVQLLCAVERQCTD